MDVLAGWLKGLAGKEKEEVDQWRATGVVLLEVIKKMEVTKEMLVDKKKKFPVARLLTKVAANKALSESECWISFRFVGRRRVEEGIGWDGFADSLLFPFLSRSSINFCRSTKSRPVARGHVLDTARDHSDDGELGRRRERGRSVRASRFHFLSPSPFPRTRDFSSYASRCVEFTRC